MLSIRTKLIGILVTIVLVPLLILGLFAHDQATDMLTEHFKAASFRELEEVDRLFIAQGVRDTESVLRFFASSLTPRVLNSPDRMRAVQKEWQTYLKLNPERWYVYFGTETGDITVAPDWTPSAGYDPRVRPWYMAAMARPGRVVWTDPYKEYITGQPVVSAAVTVVSSDGDVLGVLGIDTRLANVAGMLGHMAVGEEGYMLLLNGSGRVISGLGGSDFGRDMSVESWYSVLLNSQQGSFLADVDGHEMLISHLTDAVTGWRIVGFNPVSVLQKKVFPVRMSILFMGLGCVAGGVLLAILFSTYATRKMAEAEAYMNQVELGDFTLRTIVDSDDEFGRMNRKFNTMVRQLDETLTLMRRRSITDGLTGLYNHRHMMEELSRAVDKAARYNSPLSVIMFDLDHFKRVNDTLGHPVGDKVLVNVATLIREAIRSSDYAGRYGGEEFLLILPETGKEMAFSVAERVRLSVEASTAVVVEGEPVRITISGGVACFSGQNFSELVAEADSRLYEAKGQGRNKICLA